MSSGFITETELSEARQRRQEEWEKVRKPDDPLERPEEPIDHRSLYDRLQEQKQKKDLEYEEAHKLKNMIKGLDDDEIEFLDLVDRTKMAADLKKNLEEQKELDDYRNRVASLQEKVMEEKLQVELSASKTKPVVTSNRLNQQKLLKGVVINKNNVKKRKLSESNDNKNGKEEESSPVKKLDCENADKHLKENDVYVPGMQCIGILPGLGCYTESSSECSSDSDEECSSSASQVDMLGRKINKKEKQS